MKKILASILLTTMASSAFADQCAVFNEEIAGRLDILVNKGSVVLNHCSTCRENPNKAVPYVVTSKTIRGGGATINGKPVDLAYFYVKTAPGIYSNVAQTVGCDVVDVQPIVWKR